MVYRYPEDNKKKWNAVNRDRVRAEQKKWRDANPEGAKARRLKAKYGLSPEDYDALYQAQDGRCAICGTHQSQLSKRLAVDHDHTTGAIRALLCLRCNLGLGYLDDSPETLRKAASYLEKHVSNNGPHDTVSEEV